MDKIIIDNRDTAFTVDTYQTFTYDLAEETEIDIYNREHNTDYNHDNFIWTYDNPGYLEALSRASIEEVRRVIAGDIVIDIEYLASGAPREYNYTTDYYRATWSYDRDKLVAWIQEHIDNFREFYSESWRSILPASVTISEYLERCYTRETPPAERYGEERDSFIVAMLDYYSRTIYNETAGSFFESYYYGVVEAVDPYEFITCELDTETIETPAV